MPGLLTRARTALALGVPNIARAFAYGAGVRSGLNPVRRLQAEVPAGPFFAPARLAPVPLPARTAWVASGTLFSRWVVELGESAPAWLANPLTGAQVPNSGRPWWQIPDFSPAVGDIKLIWELSRMDWAVALAQRARNGDEAALQRLNGWLDNWFCANPPYHGPNWKCGQEASIRVMQLACTAIVLGQVRSALPGLSAALRVHLQRIVPTMMYAVAQDNNHGTSEAAALYIGGSWLDALGDPDGGRWMRMGLRWLENRAQRLIGEQGSFSQYSVNYHRVMLDTYSLAEAWRRHLGMAPLSARLQARLRAAAEWLRHMTSSASGDAPNLGANDGARLLQLSDANYRDHRPAVQLAMVLFAGQRAYAEEGNYDEPLRWLEIPPPDQVAPDPGHYIADDGGFAMLRRGRALAVLRYPRFRFRPSQADALHLDFWRNDENVLRDAGTYSYNASPEWLAYFGGAAGHNTVQFDGRDQMPRLSRFLFGDWLATSSLQRLEEDRKATTFAAGYRDRVGAVHKRTVALEDGRLRVNDELGGRFGLAVLRWRLAPGNWELVERRGGGLLVNAAAGLTLAVSADVAIARFELVDGWESRHYLEKTQVPVLEVEVRRAARLTTEVSWAS